jgi:hypothetical protein
MKLCGNPLTAAILPRPLQNPALSSFRIFRCAHFFALLALKSSAMRPDRLSGRWRVHLRLRPLTEPHRDGS